MSGPLRDINTNMNFIQEEDSSVPGTVTTYIGTYPKKGTGGINTAATDKVFRIIKQIEVTVGSVVTTKFAYAQDGITQYDLPGATDLQWSERANYTYNIF